MENKNANKLDFKMLGSVALVLFITLVVINVIVFYNVDHLNTRNNGNEVTAQKEQNNQGSEEEELSYWEERIEVGDIVTFGTYEQDNNKENGAEPIEWIVAGKEGENFLLISHYVLDCQPYHTGKTSNSDADGLSHKGLMYYENSDMRSWLNDTFAAEAFGEREKKFILPVSVKEDSVTAMNDNNYATDLVFIPSLIELRDNLEKANQLGTDSNGYQKLGASGWMCPATDYAINLGCKCMTNKEVLKNYNKQVDSNMRFTEDSYNDPEIMKYATGGVKDQDYLVKGNYGRYWIRDRFYDEDKVANANYFVSSLGVGFYEDMQNTNGVRPAIYVHIKNPGEDSAEENASVNGEDAKEYMKKYADTEYVDVEMDHVLKFYSSQIEILCNGHVVTDDIDKVSLSGSLWCLQKTMKVSDFKYYKENGKDCFINEKEKYKLVYDAEKDMWSSYSNADSVTSSSGAEKGEWVLWFEYYSENSLEEGMKKYQSEQEIAKEEKIEEMEKTSTILLAGDHKVTIGELDGYLPYSNQQAYRQMTKEKEENVVRYFRGTSYREYVDEEYFDGFNMYYSIRDSIDMENSRFFDGGMVTPGKKVFTFWDIVKTTKEDSSGNEILVYDLTEKVLWFDTEEEKAECWNICEYAVENECTMREAYIALGKEEEYERYSEITSGIIGNVYREYYKKLDNGQYLCLTMDCGMYYILTGILDRYLSEKEQTMEIVFGNDKDVCDKFLRLAVDAIIQSEFLYGYDANLNNMEEALRIIGIEPEKYLDDSCYTYE